MKTLKEKELLSWKAIWEAVTTGQLRHVQAAINEHVDSFPVADQTEVRLRTVHIVREYQRDTNVVKGHIRRVDRTIRTLQQGCFSARAPEKDHRHAH
jgi:hypothetical protein